VSSAIIESTPPNWELVSKDYLLNQTGNYYEKYTMSLVNGMQFIRDSMNGLVKKN